MRVALLCNNFQPFRGWATLTVHLGAALAAQGVEVVAITAVDDGPPQGLEPVDVRPVLPSLYPRGTALRLLAANGRVARATADCDLLHVIAEPYALACRQAARQRPVVLTACGTYVPLTASAGPLRRAYAAAYRATRMYAISRYTAMRVTRAMPGLEPEVILPGVDFAAYQGAGEPPPLARPLVVTTGGFKRRKGTHVLVQAMVEVVKAAPETRCAILGSCPDTAYANRTLQSIDELGLSDHIHLPGRVSFDALVGWYRAATVFALPSANAEPVFEGFGLVLLEAQAAGTPVIGSRQCGNEDALVDGATGFLVDQEDAAELAARILELVANPPQREAMGGAARAFAAGLDWSVVAARYAERYRRLLAE